MDVNLPASVVYILAILLNKNLIHIDCLEIAYTGLMDSLTNTQVVVDELQQDELHQDFLVVRVPV